MLVEMNPGNGKGSKVAIRCHHPVSCHHFSSKEVMWCVSLHQFSHMKFKISSLTMICEAILCLQLSGYVKMHFIHIFSSRLRSHCSFVCSVSIIN